MYVRKQNKKKNPDPCCLKNTIHSSRNQMEINWFSLFCRLCSDHKSYPWLLYIIERIILHKNMLHTEGLNVYITHFDSGS